MDGIVMTSVLLPVTFPIAPKIDFYIILLFPTPDHWVDVFMQLLVTVSLSWVITVILQAIALYIKLGWFSLMHLTMQLFILTWQLFILNSSTSTLLRQSYKVLLQFFAACLSPCCL